MLQWFEKNSTKLLIPIFILLIIFVCHPTLFQGKVYKSGDARNADAFTISGNSVLEEEGYPQWNPYLFAGMPTYGSMTYNRFVYFPSEVFNFLQTNLHFPPMTWLIAHLFFGAIGMVYLLTRWELSLPAKLTGATIWILFPKVVAWGVFGHGSKLGAAMFIPWIIALTIDVLDGKGRRKAGILALLLGMQFLRGHVQISYYTLLAVGVLFLVQIFSTLKSKGSLKQSGLLILPLVAGIMIGMALLWPSHEYAELSVRGGVDGGASYDFATGWSMSPYELGSLFFPSIAGFGKLAYQGGMPFNDYPNYIGLIPFCLLALALFGNRKKYTITFLIIAFLAILVSFGKHFPVFYDLLYNYLPYFNKFRVPSMVFILVGFTVAILAPIGLSKLEKMEKLKIPGIALLAISTIILVLSTDLMKPIFESSYSSIATGCDRNEPSTTYKMIAWATHSADLLRIGLLVMFTGIIVLLVGIYKKLGRFLPWAVLAIVIIDYSGVNGLITSPENGLYEYRSGPLSKASSPVVDFLPSNNDAAPVFIKMADIIGHQRVWPLGQLANTNEPMLASIRSLGGYHPAKMSGYDQIRSKLNDPYRPAGFIASWLGANYVLLDQKLTPELVVALKSLGVDLVQTSETYGNLFLYKNLNALPRARLVGKWEIISENSEKFLERISIGKLQSDRVYLDREPDVLPEPFEGDYPPVEFVFDGSNTVSVKTAAKQPAILVLADMWSPGWQVYVDGDLAPLMKADHFIRAVALPAGEHEVVFKYSDASLKQGLIFTLIGLVIAIGLIVIPQKRDKEIMEGS